MVTLDLASKVVKWTSFGARAVYHGFNARMVKAAYKGPTVSDADRIIGGFENSGERFDQSSSCFTGWKIRLRQNI